MIFLSSSAVICLGDFIIDCFSEGAVNPQKAPASPILSKTSMMSRYCAYAIEWSCIYYMPSQFNCFTVLNYFILFLSVTRCVYTSSVITDYITLVGCIFLIVDLLLFVLTDINVCIVLLQRCVISDVIVLCFTVHLTLVLHVLCELSRHSLVEK